MKKLFLFRFLLLVIGFGAGAASALEISCPLTTANRTLSDTLPAGWRVVPYSERVASTRITTSGALQTLICDYGQAGLVQKNGPTDYVCTSRTGGFTCALVVISGGTTPTATPGGPIIYRSGSVALRAGYDIDFDTGVQATGSAQADLVFRFDATHSWTVDTVGSSAYWRHNRPAPIGKSGCAAEVGIVGTRYLTHPYSITPPGVGNSACVITGQGRLAEFTVTGFSTTDTGVQIIQFTYTTWPL